MKEKLIEAISNFSERERTILVAFLTFVMIFIFVTVWFFMSSAIDDRKVATALELAQLTDFVAALPGGAEYTIGENGSRLSGGQRQRLCIARALYHEPKLLILDEATSALDRETEAALVDALETLRGKLTMVVIAHRLSTVEKCDLRLDLDADAPRLLEKTDF